MSSGVDPLTCPHCGQRVPPGEYCGNCGAHLAAPGDAHRRRGWAYAAAPAEHVVQLSLVSTFFPHLPHHQAHAFRRALPGGLVVVIALVAFGQYAAATLAASLVLPILYLLYLYDSEVYEHEPVLVVAATFVAGGVLGGAATFVLGNIVAGFCLCGPTVGSVLVGGVAAPVIGQAVMLAGPLLLLRHRHFDEALDGLAFGVTSAIGYSLATMLVVFGPVVIATPLDADPLDWGVRILRQGFLVVAVNAATTAAITTSVWLRHNRRGRTREHQWWRSLPFIVTAALAVQVGLGIAAALLGSLLQVAVIWLVASVVAILFLRVIIHHALLDEAPDSSAGEDVMCVECHHVVPAMAFCPNCGVARSAAPKVRRRPTAAAEARA